MVSSRRAASKSTPCTYHGALIPKAASNSWVWFIGSRCLAGLVAAFCRNQPSLSLLLQRASSIRFAGPPPALDPPTHPLRIEKRRQPPTCPAFSFYSALTTPVQRHHIEARQSRLSRPNASTT